MKSLGIILFSVIVSGQVFACPDFSGEYRCYAPGPGVESFRITQYGCDVMGFNLPSDPVGNPFRGTWETTGKVNIVYQSGLESSNVTYFFEDSVVRSAESRNLVSGELTTYRWQYQKKSGGLVYSALVIRGQKIGYETESYFCQRL